MSRREIFKRAWEIRRETATELGCKVSDVSMGGCLKIVYSENRNNDTHEYLEAWLVLAKATTETLGNFSKEQIKGMVNSPHWDLGRKDAIIQNIRKFAEVLDTDLLITKTEHKGIDIAGIIMSCIEIMIV